MKKYILIALTALSGLFFYACTHKDGTVAVINTVNPNDTTHHVTDTTMTEVFDTSVCFERDVLPIFQGSCGKSGTGLSCHSATDREEGYILDSYVGIIAKGLKPGNAAGSKIYTVCVSGSMPQYPTPKLDSTQLSYIKRWINMGAHNDTGCAANCDTTKFTYTGAIAPMMKSYCNSCHATAAASASGGGIILDTYTGIQTQALNGKLMGTMQHTSGFSAMPKGGAKLSDCKITQVRRWIAAGAQNN